MCNGCSTVTCQCKPQRLPKVGEKWTYDDKSVDVLAVTEEAVLYKGGMGIMFRASSLKGFCDSFHPPKPKPRELYIQATSGILFRDGSPSFTKEYTDKYPQYKFVKFVEVLD